MSAFNDGFTSELVKLGGIGGALAGAGKWVGKDPFRRGVFPALTGLFVGGAGYAGAKAAQNKKQRLIKARVVNGRVMPSAAVTHDYHAALGMKKNPTKLQKERQSVNFARYRERA